MTNISPNKYYLLSNKYYYQSLLSNIIIIIKQILALTNISHSPHAHHSSTPFLLPSKSPLASLPEVSLKRPTLERLSPHPEPTGTETNFYF